MSARPAPARHPLYLRERCDCPECRDPRSGQRLVGLADLEPSCAVVAVEDGGGERVLVTFAPDGHRSLLPRELLDGGDAGRYEVSPPVTSRRERRTWLADDLGGAPPSFGWHAYLDDPAVTAAALASVVELGVALLVDGPRSAGSVLGAARRFGFVRTTNYGELFDVRVEPSPANLATSDRALALHTDNPYRDPVPTVQLLHCLESAADGGLTRIADGLAAAERLRAEEPGAFALLALTPVRYSWSDGAVALRAEHPVLTTGPHGEVREVRVNGRSMEPVELDGEELVAFQRAYRRLVVLLEQPGATVSFPLAPGQCLLLDNTRILHARTAFADRATTRRHLQGCYADVDGLRSTLAMLDRSTATLDRTAAVQR